jgi:DNA-binding Lrp family transcriptional regulator
VAREGLDSRDWAILRELRENGRIATSELAKKVNLAPTPCKVRIDRLQRDGYIKKYTIELGSGKERRVVKYILIELSVTTDDVVETILTILKSHASVTAIHTIEGKFDFLVRIDEMNIDVTGDIIRDLRATKLVTDTFTASVLDTWYATDTDVPRAPDWFTGGV